MSTKIQVKMVRSAIARPETQQLTLAALGLRKINQTRVFNDSPALRGQLEKVKHIVEWHQIEE